MQHRVIRLSEAEMSTIYVNTSSSYPLHLYLHLHLSSVALFFIAFWTIVLRIRKTDPVQKEAFCSSEFILPTANLTKRPNPDLSDKT